MEHPYAEAAPASSFHSLKVVTPRKSTTALGMAVAFLMRDPAFARLPFGHWSSVLAGQITRRHYVFIVDGNRIVGFAGWALTTKDKAEGWLAGRQEISFANSRHGDVVVINAWKATTPVANRFLLNVVRGVIMSKTDVYFKRHYANGTARVARLSVTRAVAGHLARGGVTASSNEPGNDCTAERVPRETMDASRTAIAALSDVRAPRVENALPEG